MQLIAKQKAKLHFVFVLAGRGKEARQVCSGHDTFLLIASSAVDMEQWIGVINRIIYAVSKLG